MEEFVSTLLHNADLTVLTKKLVRVKYREHIGRTLSNDEKDKINCMVYAFIKEYAEKEKKSESSSPDSVKSRSPGDKENRETNNQKIVLKGHVIDKQRLKKVNRQPQPAKKVKTKVTEPVKSYPKRKRTPRLEFSDVMTAVMESDNMDDSSEQEDEHSSSSQCDEDSLSDVEPQEDMKQALASLNKARDHKIQLSQEKKHKFATKGTTDRDTAKKSLYGKTLLNSHNKEDGNTSGSSVILISEDDGLDRTTVSKKLGSSVSAKNRSNTDLHRTPLKNIREEMDTSDSSFNHTPETYSRKKTKRNITLTEKTGSRIKKRKISKKRAVCSDSDSDSEMDIPLAKRQKVSNSHNAKSSALGNSKVSASNLGSKLAENETNHGKMVQEATDSDSSTGDTPLAKKQKKKKPISKNTGANVDSDSSTGDTPLAKKQKKKNSNSKNAGANENDSDSSTEDTPLASKKLKNRINDSGIELSSSVSNKQDIKAINTSDSELSTEETPLAKKLKVLKSKSKQVIIIDSNNSDSNMSTGDTPLAKKGKTLNSKLKGLHMAVLSDSDSSTGDTPLAKKRGKFNWKMSDSDANSDSSFEDTVNNKQKNSDSSSGDTPLASKQKKLKKKSEARCNQDVIDIDSDDSLEESPLAQNKIDSTSSSSDRDSEKNTPVKVVKLHVKSKQRRKILQTSDDDTPVKNSQQKDSAEEETPVKLNGVRKVATPISDTDSDDSDDLPLAQLNKSTENKSQVAAQSSDDEQNEATLKGPTKAKKVKQGKQKEVKKPAKEEASSHLKQLRKICRACGMFIRNDRELKGCNSDKQKIKRLKEHLQNAGMKGQPSLKKAEEIRLRKEAAELNEDNIISTEAGVGKRKVRSLYSKRKASPKKSPSPRKQMKNVFGGLKGIIDSEGSDED